MAVAVAKKLYIRDTDLAARYDVHRSTIWRWVKNGTIPQPRTLGPGCKRWNINDLERWEMTTKQEV